ncbi:MAG: hypothetical protein C4538_08820 [Nitrospiraceae bacterium]|nr:MAG: hypothetical protein C4538_08820 [Nitrospiraceae bacterium]
MTLKKGMIALMGSGELTSTMVEVHKEILSMLGSSPKAVFIDTPAGFQLNADELSQRAVEYFRTRVQHPMSVVSFKSKYLPPLDAQEAFRSLREADYMLVGPGSPTYAVRHWKDTPVPEILAERIMNGGCLVAASAAALTVGRFTLPVYEIYKVGEDLHWVDGIDILGHFGLHYIVIPHWNNAEGGTHDTRCCFIGESRFNSLASLLPPDVGIIGIDEHTACILHFESNEAIVRGIGSVTIRLNGVEKIFQHGASFSMDILYGRHLEEIPEIKISEPALSSPEPVESEGKFWNIVHSLEQAFHKGLETDPKSAANAVLELDRTIWKAQQDLENIEFITQAREVLRELIVLLGSRLASSPGSREDCLGPLIVQMLELRESLRKNRQWKYADAVRDCLSKANIIIEDTPEGSHWRVSSE